MGLPIPTPSGLNAAIVKGLEPVTKKVFASVLSIDASQIGNLNFLIEMIASTSKPLYENIGGPYTLAVSKLEEAKSGDPTAVFGLADIAGSVADLPTKKKLTAVLAVAVKLKAKEVLDELVISKDPTQLDTGITSVVDIITGMANGMVDLFVALVEELLTAIAALGVLEILPIPEFPTVETLTAALVEGIIPVAEKTLAGSVTSIPGHGQDDNIKKLIDMVAGVAEGFTAIMTTAFAALADLLVEVQAIVEDKMDILKPLL